MANSCSRIRAVARCVSGPGAHYTRSSTAGVGTRVPQNCRSYAVSSSESTSSTSRNPVAEQTRHSDSGGPDPARWTSNDAFVPTCGALTSSTHSGSRKAPSAGRRPSSARTAQAHRWTWLIVAAYNELRLARGLVADRRLPWERPCDPTKLTPPRVRRGFRQLRATLGTPGLPPKFRTPGPGRPRGTRRPPRTRYPAVKKAA